MKLILSGVAILLSMTVFSVIQESAYNKITRNNMTFYWLVEGELLHCKMTAPTQGWVAVGFNTSNQLTGTHLVMGCVEAGKTRVEDRHTVKPGDYPLITELGGSDALTAISGLENDYYTTISFTIPLKAADQFHHNLLAGEEFTLLMAYSREDDFEHHSIMRTSVQVKL